MATFQQDPLDLQTSDVKYYLGKITGAGNIGSRDQGEPLKYFNPQDIGVVQSTAILQPFNTDEFKRPATQDNTAWINFLNPANPSDTTNSTTYTVGPFSRTVTWTVGLTNRDTEVNYVTKVLSHFDDLIVGPNTFGTVFLTRIRSDLTLASPSLQDSILTSNDLRDSLTDIRDGDSYITESSGENTYFYKQNEDKNLFNALNSIYASSYDGGQDIIYNKGFSDFQSFYQTFEDFKDTININIAPIFDSKVGYLNLLKSLTPYDNVISGVIGNYQLTNTLDLTGISGYPTGYEDGKYLRSTTTGLEYVDITDPVLAFTGLSDTPSTITPNEYLRGTADGQNLMFSGVSFLEDVTDRPTVPQSGYLQRTPAGQLVWAAGTTSGDITYNFTGSDFFTGLQDTPANYDQFKFLRSALNSIEYVDINEGIVSFTGLDGTQNDFSAGKYLISSATGIEYTDIPAPVLTFTGLTDTPSSFTNASGQYLRINSAENAVEFIDISGQINSHEIAWDTYLRFGDLPPASNHAGMFTYVMIDSLSGAYVSNGTDWVKIDSDSEEGSSSFTGLSDTPNSYDSGKYLISSATGIEYVDVVAPVVAFTGLTDTPSSYAGQSGRYLMVSDAETGIEFKDPTFYTGAFVGFGGAIVFKGLDTYAPLVGWNDRKLTNLVGISGIKETYLDNEQIVLPKGKYLISAEGGVNCDSSAGVNPAGKTKIGIEFTSGDYIGQTFDSFSNRGQTAGNYGQIRGSIQVAIESQNPIKFKVKSYLPSVQTPAEYSFDAAQTDVSILDLGASKDFLSFTGLLDVPNTFDGASGKYLRVSDDQTELEYVDIPDPAVSFTGLTDTPSYLTPDKYLKVDPAGTGFVFADAQASTTGITGAFNIGAGSGVVSGVVDQDAYFKSLVGGTNVTLSSDDSTITINAAGGGGGDSSGCCNTIKIRKNDADVPTSEMAREVISNLYFGYARAGGYPYSYYYANLDNITDGDSNTYWQPYEGHNTFSSQWGHSVQARINFNTDIYINSIEWEGDPWYGKVQKIQSSSGTLWQRTSNNQYGVTPFTTDDINQTSTSALVGKAYQIKQGWSTITTDPNAVPSYDFSNLPAGGKLNQIYWTNPYSQTNNNAGMPFVSLVGNGRQGRYPTIKNIKLAYALTDPSVPNYIVQRPFAGGISASTNATIYLQRGQSYTFEVESDGNPFYIKTANVGGTSDLFSAGITNNGVGDGDLTFQVPYDAPETLYYVSSNVPTLSGMIKILAADGGSFSSSGVTDISNVGVGSGVASGVVDNTGYFKSLIGGTNLQILGDENSLTLNVTGVSGSTVSGITGVDSLGAGSALASGISASDLRLKSLVGGTNVTLSSDDSTITIDAAGGGGGGSTSSGFANWSGISDLSNLYTGIPEYLYVERANGYTVARLEIARSTDFQYTLNPTANKWLSFSNDAEGTYSNGDYTYNGTTQTWAAGAAGGGGTGPSLSGLVVAGQVFYNGAGGGSTTSGGITGVESLGAGSALASGILESDLRLKSLVGGTNVTLSSDDSTITIDAAGGGGGASNAQGTYTGDGGLAGDLQFIDLGFTPEMVQIQGPDFTSAGFENPNAIMYRSMSGVSWSYTHGDGGVSHDAWQNISTEGGITGNGFVAPFGPGFNNNGIVYNYMAFGAGGDAGGSSSSGVGVGNSEFFKATSNYYTRLPDQITFNHPSNGWTTAAYLNIAGTSSIVYSSLSLGGLNSYLSFTNNSQGDYISTAGNSYPVAYISGMSASDSLSGLIGSGVFEGVYYGGGSSSSTTGITGAYNLGSGSGILSGVSDNDLVFRTIQAGPNVTIDEIGSGLRISASTTHVTVTGGTVSGGVGSNPFVTGASNFYTKLPDSLIFTHAGPGPIVFDLNYIDPNYIYYIDHTMSTERRFRVNNNLEGSSPTWQGGGGFNPTDTLSGLIASGRGVYLGGGSGSSSSTTGITGASNIGAGSAIVSGISSNDLKVKSLVGGTNVTLSSDDSTITIDAAGGGGGSAGGDGPGNSTYYTGFSNFYTELPDWIAVKGTDSNPIHIAYLSSIDGGSTFRYSHTVDGATTRYTYNFNNNTSGSFNSEDWVGTVTETPSLSGLLVSGRAGYMGGGSGGGSSSSAGVSVVPSSYVGDGAATGIYIELDFVPSQVYIRSDGSALNGGPYYGETTLLLTQSGQNTTYFYNTPTASRGYTMIGTISGKGFLAIGNINDSAFNVLNCTYNYIAISSGGGGSSSSSSATGITGATNLGAGSGLISGILDNDLQVKSLVGGTNLQITGDGESLYLNVTGISGSTVSGLTGASNIGSGSGIFSGISDNDLVFRTIEAGPNVSITESSSGLKISASTTSVTVTGGTVSGGLGSNPYVTGQSNFYSSLPDQIVLTNASDNNSPSAFSLYYVSSTLIYYSRPHPVTGPFTIIFDNNASATFDSYLNTSAAAFGAGQSISGYAASGRGVYLGGGSGSSSSTSGITGVESLGAGSALASGILESDLRLKSLVGGTNVTLSSDDSTITIDAAGGGGGASNAQGTYTGDGGLAGDLQFIDLGFTPEMVQIQGPDFTSAGFENPNAIMYRSMSGVSWSYTHGDGGVSHDAWQNISTEGGITGNGFVAPFGPGFNNNGIVYNYMAFGAGGSSSSSTTGITGASNIGAGSAIVSGISSNDLKVKSLVGGTNVTLSSDDSTITIDAAGGGGAGGDGPGNSTYYTGFSNFYTELPDWIAIKGTNSDPILISYLSAIDGGSTFRYSHTVDGATTRYIYNFNNNAAGTFNSYIWGGGAVTETPSLSGLLVSGRAGYMGGGSDSSSSTTGITGASNIGAGSAIVSGISSNDLKVKSLVGGTNVTLSSDDSTITIDAAGGGGAGTSSAFSSNSITSEWSNFYTDVPDALVLEDNGGNTGIFTVNQLLTSYNEIYYENRYYNGNFKYITFANTTSGETGVHMDNVSTPVTSLSGLVASGRGMYYGGGGGGGGGALDGYVLSTSSGYLADASSYDIILDGTSNYIVDVIGRYAGPVTYYFMPISLKFKIDSSDGTITEESDHWAPAISSSYDVPTKTLTLSTDASHEILSSQIFKEASSSSSSDCSGCGVPVVPSTFAGKVPQSLIADYYYNGGAVKYKMQVPFMTLGDDGYFYYEMYNEGWSAFAGGRMALKFNDDSAGTVVSVSPSAGTYYFPDTTRTLSDYIASGDVIY